MVVVTAGVVARRRGLPGGAAGLRPVEGKTTGHPRRLMVIVHRRAMDAVRRPLRRVGGWAVALVVAPVVA